MPAGHLRQLGRSAPCCRRRGDKTMNLRAKTASFIFACMFALAPSLVAAAPRQPTAADIDKLRATKAALAETVLEKLGGSRILFKVDIERRLHDGGIREVGLRPDGTDGIRVLLPGVANPQAATAIFSQKTRVAFRLVDLSMTAQEAPRSSPAACLRSPLRLQGQDPLFGFERERH